MSHSKSRLLIVDDEPDVLLSLRSIFRREYEVFTAASAHEALDLLTRQEVDVVLSDHRMAGMSGADLLAKIRNDFPDVIRLMITGYAEIESVIDAINRGHIYRYITKPWDPADLEMIVRQAAEQHQLVIERRRLLRELEEANQLKTAFITVASHELNTPLTIVMGMMQLAEAKNGDPVVAGYLQRARCAAERLNERLINTFKMLEERNYHRLLEREPVNISDLFADIHADLEPYLQERRQRIELSIAPADLEIEASRAQLRDVLENLLTNAIKFSPDGSAIGVKANAEGSTVRFEVSDTGAGIAWGDQPHVFEPFFSTWDFMRHSTGDYGYGKRGLGLGLAIVKRFVDAHGGTVEFDTTPGEGTTFRIVLPIKASD